MAEEYESIMKNDVWNIVPRPKGKFVVTSKWLFKIKHGVDGSILRNIRQGLWPKDSPGKREKIMMFYLHLWLDIQPFIP